VNQNRKKILVLAKTLPLHDRASGDFRLSRILEILARHFEVDFLSTTHAALDRKTGKLEYLPRDSRFGRTRLELLDQEYIDDLEKLGVHALNQAEPAAFTVRSQNEFDIRPYLEKKSYDLIWVEFFYLAEQTIGEIRRLQPQAKVVCDSVDLHFRRLARQCNYFEGQARYLVNSRHEKKSMATKSQRQRLADQRRHADDTRERELRAYQRCDAVAVVSEDDRETLQGHCPQLPLLFVPNIHRKPEQTGAMVPWEKRHGCVFVGNFDHDPNVSSALYLKHEVAGLLKKEIPFHIVGSSPPKVVRTMAECGPAAGLFTVTGYVPSTLPYLESAKVSVAPILFGAGMNGKIGEALSAGLPVVTTSLGAQGMGLVHEQTCLVADEPAAFAHAIQRLHDDGTLWEKLRAAGLAHVEKLYSREGLEEEIVRSVTKLLPRASRKPAERPASPTRKVQLAPPVFPAAPARPKFSVIVLTHNKWGFTELCLRSLAHAEREDSGLAEYILVDNGSTDGTPAYAGRIPGLRVLAQTENLGFAAGNNQGIKAARGENVILLNNDTVVTPGWLKRFQHHVDSIPDLGVLGPSTNTETGQNFPGARYQSIAELFALNENLGRESGAWERVRKISGLCFLITRAALDKVGLLDTSFALGYFEDDDFCLRAEDAGLTNVHAKDVFVHHFGSASFRGRRVRCIEDGMARFAFKWGKRGLEHIARQHQETLLRSRRPRSLHI
jgi:GT2 family glycosyltransferase/glycosyltransferase involved in cell wall biosynthesis